MEKRKIKVEDHITKEKLKSFFVGKCTSCEGNGKTYGHGAFGERETSPCYRCGGLGISLQRKPLKPIKD